jgi:hypothetical protein
MKTIAISVIITLIMIMPVTSQSNGEYQSLLSPSSEVKGWFVEFDGTATILNGNHAWMPGFAAGAVFNGNQYLGLKAKSFSWHERSIGFNNLLPEPCYLSGGYLAIYAESSVRPWEAVHLTFPFTAGGGGAVYLSKSEYPEMDDDMELDFSKKESSASPFFLLEPGVNLEMNVTGYLKIFVGYSYRWLFGLDLENTQRNAFNNSNLNIGVKIGRFN